MKFVRSPNPLLVIGGSSRRGSLLHIPLPPYADIQLLQLWKVLRWAEAMGPVPTETSNPENLELLNLGWEVYTGSPPREGRFSGMLRALHALMKLPRNKLDRAIEFGEVYDFGRGIGHASKVTQMAILLWLALAERLGLGEGSLEPLVLAAVLHDIGVGIDEENHNFVGAVIVRSVGWLEGFEAELVSRLIYHHRPSTDLRGEGYPVRALASILRVADGLDYSLNQAVWDIKVGGGECPVVTVVCRGLCHGSLERAIKKAGSLRDLLGCLEFEFGGFL
ncbi:HD domain-containing protein [Thermococcus sp.]|uniref:HD domain-containing protein n=1 Tax=Thermococcus sp. TaxID=35749 RepID=UPI00261737D3|nr:HD domain-containing protein [Thermococcus sp.]